MSDTYVLEGQLRERVGKGAARELRRNSMVPVVIYGDKKDPISVAYQLEPVRDFIEHVDFLRVSKNTVVTVEIPVTFLNDEDCPGIKKGGILNVVRHTVEVNCPADSIPDGFEVDLLPFEMGDSINVSSIALPEGVEPTITDRDFTVATIAAPGGAQETDDEEGAPEAPETEVIGEKKEEDE